MADEKAPRYFATYYHAKVKAPLGGKRAYVVVSPINEMTTTTKHGFLIITRKQDFPTHRANWRRSRTAIYIGTSEEQFTNQYDIRITRRDYVSFTNMPDNWQLSPVLVVELTHEECVKEHMRAKGISGTLLTKFKKAGKAIGFDLTA